jgi:hypothetical protein
MLVVTYAPDDELPAEHYNGVQQLIDLHRLMFSRMLSQPGYTGSGTNNGSVVQKGAGHATLVTVNGPAYLWVNLTAPTLLGMAPFYKAAAEDVTVPALNTSAGQSRQDLVVARVNVGSTDTYEYTTIQGTPATTGAQTDPSLGENEYALARITRAHGDGNLVTSMITDLRQAAKVAAAHQA